MLNFAVVGLMFVALGIIGAVSRRFFGLLGVAMIEVAIFGVIPLWASKAFKEIAEATKEEKNFLERLTEFEKRKGPALVGGVFFLGGTLVQFMATIH